MNASTFRKFDVLAVVTVKNSFFWDFTQYYYKLLCVSEDSSVLGVEEFYALKKSYV